MEDLGFISVIPPVLAIALAIATKDVVISLSLGIFVGILFLVGGNPFVAMYVFIKDYLFVQLADSYNVQSMFVPTVIGGFVALLLASGGAHAFTEKVTPLVSSRRRAEVATWLAGLFVWFTDLGNSLIVGPIFEDINESMKVSREKFSYILDCTTSPICSMIPIIGWGVYIMSLIEKELSLATVPESITAWSVFVSSVPYNFYAIMTLFMCGFMAWTQWDFGPMLRAEARATSTGRTIREGAVPLRRTREIELPEGVKPNFLTMLIPLAVLLTSIFVVLYLNGFPYKPVKGSIIRVAITYGFLSGTLALFVLVKFFGIMDYKKSMSVWIEGMSGMVYLCVVLLLAWSIGSLAKSMGTATYLARIGSNLLTPGLLPAIFFLTGAVISLATGTSWGTYALLMPLGIPLALEIGAPLAVMVGAIVGGGLFGDHASPISDTTILASMGAGSDHVDHFQTQMPYALTVGILSMGLFVLAGNNPSPILVIPGTLLLCCVIFVLHRLSLAQLKKSDKIS